MLCRPDKCPKCGSLEWTAVNADGSRFDNSKQVGLWSHMKCDDCGHMYPFCIVEIVETREQRIERGNEVKPVSRKGKPRRPSMV